MPSEPVQDVRVGDWRREAAEVEASTGTYVDAITILALALALRSDLNAGSTSSHERHPPLREYDSGGCSHLRTLHTENAHLILGTKKCTFKPFEPKIIPR